MIRNLKGLILDDKKPIEFAVIYRSDINGKLITNPTLTSKSDENGFWILNGLSNTDYITTRLVGYDTKTISVANFLSDTINIPLKKSSVILEEVEIIDKVDKTPKEIPKEIPNVVTTPPKKMSKALIQSILLVSGFLVIASIIYLIIPNKK